MAAMRLLLQSFQDGQWRDVDNVPLVERGKANPFQSGKVGYNGNDKVMLPSSDGSGELKQHQFTANIVEIVPKAGADPGLTPGSGRSTEQPIAGKAK